MFHIKRNYIKAFKDLNYYIEDFNVLSKESMDCLSGFSPTKRDAGSIPVREDIFFIKFLDCKGW